MNVLTLENVSYTYPGGVAPVVKNASHGFESGKLLCHRQSQRVREEYSA